MTSAADQAAQVAADTKALAITDLATLQAFQAMAVNPISTVGQLETGMSTLAENLGDPNRQLAIAAMQGSYQAFLGQLATMISQTNALANPPT